MGKSNKGKKKGKKGSYIEISDGCSSYVIGEIMHDHTKGMLMDFDSQEIQAAADEDVEEFNLRIRIKHMHHEDFNNLPEFGGF